MPPGLWSASPGHPDADYQRGTALARVACRQEPENGSFLNAFGVAQYRTGLVAAALASLTRSNDLKHQKEPGDLAFLALAQHRLGLSEKTRDTLARLREGDERSAVGRESGGAGASCARPRRSSSTTASRPTRSRP